ncbi:interleukin-2 receptor subunit beta [Brienomyrus brachyistius]|uniref:interleukin-2 receptor subunit beta n=1 Tax=Brienomyrus brachyistius TaxID=42636 RepID=UPI0020B2AE58|nr:interleukin-2 receptor subunit beta [Brienomyrus brachyistius]XP_048871735.1 interleukin-2 receptor subunit beta [Brienomyrus brachyistius]
MWTTWLPTLLLLHSTFPQPSLQNLRCLNDLINNVTCVWNSTTRNPDTACTLQGLYQHQHKQCDLMPFVDHDQNLLRCSLLFPNVEFGSFTRLSIRITCGNASHPAVHIGTYKPSLHIKMHPPAFHTFTNTTITWSPGSPLSEYIVSYYFQLQFKRSDQIWENAESVNVRDMRTSVEISEEKLVKGVVYDFRVRALVDHEGFRGEWSDWSPVSSWRSTAGVSPTEPPALVGVQCGIPVMVLSCLVLLFIIKVKRFSWDHKFTPVPDPSKFFTGLNSVHIGSFQKWLHPVLPLEYFATPMHSEDISPIEISACDEEAREKGDSSGSWMTDSGFTQSSHSYEPLEQLCQPRQPNSKLATEVQRSMDEEEEDSDLSVFPLPFSSGLALTPDNLPGFSHFPSDLAELDLHTSLLHQSSLLNISPSSGGYMIVTDTRNSC